MVIGRGRGDFLELLLLLDDDELDDELDDNERFLLFRLNKIELMRNKLILIFCGETNLFDDEEVDDDEDDE